MLALSIISLLRCWSAASFLACFGPCRRVQPRPLGAPRPSQVDRRGLLLSAGTSLSRATFVTRTDLQVAVAPMRELAGPGSSGSVLLLSSLAREIREAVMTAATQGGSVHNASRP